VQASDQKDLTQIRNGAKNTRQQFSFDVRLKQVGTFVSSGRVFSSLRLCGFA
jgi:hypothetical protein